VNQSRRLLVRPIVKILRQTPRVDLDCLADLRLLPA
jgi:hypothetical protein